MTGAAWPKLNPDKRFPTRENGEYWVGFADAKPSEAIQKQVLPYLTVAVLFAGNPRNELFNPPIKQFKESRLRRKADDALKLAHWLNEQKSNGVSLSGFVSTIKQVTAAQFGIGIIEELPASKVIAHYDGFRLQFGDESIELAHAVALGFYYFAMIIGILRSANTLPKDRRRIFLAMDRFQGPKGSENREGQPLPQTPGAKFLNFVHCHSETGLGIQTNNTEAGIDFFFGTLDWWRPNIAAVVRKGKTHPNFILPDWLAAASEAHELDSSFTSAFSDQEKSNCEALCELYRVFKSFDIWSTDDQTMQHLRTTNQIHSIPKVARDFIFKRASI
jgi:hypothetical protein